MAWKSKDVKGAGMAMVATAENFDLHEFAQFVTREFAAFQRLLFIRLPSREIEKTGTFKFQKVQARAERFDLNVLSAER